MTFTTIITIYAIIGLAFGLYWATRNTEQEPSERIIYFVLAVLVWPYLALMRLFMQRTGDR